MNTIQWMNLSSSEYEEEEEESPLEEAVTLLREAGVKLAHGWAREVGYPLLIVEAVNHAAKVIDERFYSLKPRLISWLANRFDGGWGEDDVFYLFHEEIGVVCLHDPYNQITAKGEWPHRWSGVLRQQDAFETLIDEDLQRSFAEKTTP